jgi:acyl-CoA dehydrogenase family member 9
MRLDKGVQAMGGVMKPLIKRLIDYSINTKVHGIEAKDIDLVKEKLGALTSYHYVLESMVYMTSGLKDIYDDQDVDVESAMVQAFAIQAMDHFIVRPMHAVGFRAVIKGEGFEKYIRDAAQLSSSAEPLDSTNQFIALSGIHHAGTILNEMIKKDRNPLNHPAFFFSRFFNNVSIEQPKLKHDLEGYFHPSLSVAVTRIEMSILRLGAAVDILLGRHGPMIIQHTVETDRIAEAATLCYAMFAATSRASRSYCIGLRNADQEIHLAQCFCFVASQRVKEIAKGIDSSEYGTSEHTFKTLGKHLIDSKDYHLEHPTTRNF